MSGWRKDKRWSDKFLTQIKRILGEYLIGEPAPEEDAERNTDLIVLRLDSVRIACRVRQFQYFQSDRYWNQFTIRSLRPSGIKTEYAKIMEGWGDYFFYGFADMAEKAFAKWVLGDLNAFRIHCGRMLSVGRHPWIEEKMNHDGSSAFRAFRAQDIPGFVIAEDHDVFALADPC